MSESQRKLSERIVNYLLEAGYIRSEQYQYPFQKYYEMKFSKIDDWVKIITEAVAWAQGEELREEMNRLKAK